MRNCDLILVYMTEGQLIDYKDTLNLPRTDFPMKSDGSKREPGIQDFWFKNNIYKQVLDNRKKNNKGI